jgi:hypothetical protein
MRHIEIQRGKEGMKLKQLNKEVGAATGCTLRLLLNTIPPQSATDKHGVHGDAWFGSVRTANEVGIRGHEGVFQVKQYHTCFPKDFIEEALKEAPGGVHIILEGTTQDEVTLVTLGYRYSRKTVLHFVLTKNAGSSKPGTPYQMKYTNAFGSICTRFVDRPQVVSNFFAGSNVIDTHNQLRQDSLKLEKKWMTQNPWFHLAMTLISIMVTDAFLLCNYHKVINSGSADNQGEKHMIQCFARILAFQLIEMAKQLEPPGSNKFLRCRLLVGSRHLLAKWRIRRPDASRRVPHPLLCGHGVAKSHSPDMRQMCSTRMGAGILVAVSVTSKISSLCDYLLVSFP